MTAEALAGLVFAPLLAACAVVVLPRQTRAVWAVLGLAPLPVLLGVLTAAVWRSGPVVMAVAGFEAPLGIVWRVDGLALALLWLNAAIAVGVGLYAAATHPPASARGGRFWGLWLLLACAVNALALSADLFNLFVTLELTTVAAIGLLVVDGKPAALRAAMRYLLVALLGSLFYLLGVTLVYAQVGTLDLYQAGALLAPTRLPVTALMLMTTGLLIKAALFPLHGWLPPAHGNAPAPVSAVLSAVVVKVSVYLIWRLWLWLADGWPLGGAMTLLGVLGAGAIVYGSVQALVQDRLKPIVAYSTVAQLGYFLLVFPLLGAAGFLGATYHMLAHGLAKAAMFVAVGNLQATLGSDRLADLRGADRVRPTDVFAFALAGVSILGLPPSGGFTAKWLLLQAAWTGGGWPWLVVLLGGGLLAAAYLFRVLDRLCARPVPEQTRLRLAAPSGALPPRAASLVGLALALGAIALGFVPAPVLDMLRLGFPPGVVP